jgi:hypothetical protein
MSIIHKIKDKLPNNGDFVYCDNGNDIEFTKYNDGEFIVRASDKCVPYPMVMNNVTKWFSLKDWYECQDNKLSYVSFSRAEKMIMIGDV